MLIWIIYFTYNQYQHYQKENSKSTQKQQIKSKTLTRDADSLKTREVCNNDKNAEWRNEKCQCIYPFFGADCRREYYNGKYISLGSPKKLNIERVIDTVSDGISFNKNDNLGSCSSLCDEKEDCTGFLFNKPNFCTLIIGKVVIPKGISLDYSNDVDSTFYMKDKSNLIFTE